MTEDEAFVRTIVDSPGDDLPRLVYADWLDERGDPRGAYLRAEVELVRNDDVGGLQALRRSLVTVADFDLVWAARVSRPPAGVCCDHLWPEPANEGEPFLPVTRNQLDTLEQQIGSPLPPDYRAFQLNYNGGFPEPGSFVPRPNTIGYPGTERIQLDIFWAVHSSRRRGYIGDIPHRPSERSIRDDGKEIIHGRMPVVLVTTGHAVCFYLALGRPVAGQVFGENDSWKLNGNMHHVADSFAEFLAMLTTDTEPWERMIIRSHTEAFRRWLDAGGSVSVESEARRTPLALAVEDGRAEIVELLIERGAAPDRRVWQQAHSSKYTRIRDAVLLRYPERPTS